MAMMVRRGFTLVELLVASGMFVIVTSGLIGAFVAVQRMTASTVAVAELSIGMRELREKLLYHAAPPQKGIIWTGILSGANSDSAVVDTFDKPETIQMDSSWGYDLHLRKVVPQDINLEIFQRQASAVDVVRSFINNGDSRDDQSKIRWLMPCNFSWLPEEDAIVAIAESEGKSPHIIYVHLEGVVKNKENRNLAARSERMVVPVFGMVQRTFSETKVFDER